MAINSDAGRVPEDIEGTDFNDAENIPGGGLDADFDAIDAEDDDDDLDLNEDDMLNPITMKSMSKADDDDDKDDDDKDDDDKDDDDDDDDKDRFKDEMNKSGMTRSNLRKAIANLAGAARREDPTARQRELINKSLRKSLNHSERNELMELLDNSGPRGEAREDFSKSLRGNAKVNEAVDASDFLQEQNAELVKALGRVSKSLGSMNNRAQAYNEVLAEAVVRIGQRLDHVSDQLAKSQRAPVSAPRSMGVSGRSRALHKASMGAPSFSHDQIESALDKMMAKSVAAGRAGQTERGTDLMKAITHFDGSGQLLEEASEDVARFISENR